MRTAAGILTFAALIALAAAPAFAVQPGLDKCFEITVGGNSRGTRALFKRRDLQSGGPTWAAIMEVALKGLPALAGVAYDLDDEAEGVLVCTADAATIAVARAEYNRLNKDAKALAKVIDRVPPAKLE
ncbi:MAG TPA: hypothetical protein VGL86_04970 [Polyangia bacterium]|jgi:hypothetical protein